MDYHRPPRHWRLIARHLCPADYNASAFAGFHLHSVVGHKLPILRQAG